MDRDARELHFTTTLIYGISAELAAIFKVPVVYREIDFPSPAGTDRDWGVRDLEALLKFRLYRDDWGPARTSRFDLLAGVEFYSGDHDFATRSVDPEIGGVFTYLRDRHAIDADLLWRFDTTGDVADRMRYDLAYVHRIHPAVYQAGKFESVFGVLELNGIYESNGDNELFLSPGIQYKTKRVTWEATLQVPVWQSLDNRLESDLVVGAGVRLRF
jgi:hypothetical protein